MIRLLATAGALSAYQLSLVVLGTVLLLVWFAFRVRGRELLPRGPEPVARYRTSDAALYLLVWLAVQLTVVSLAATLGVKGANLSLVVKGAELVVVAIAALVLFRPGAHRPRPRHAAAGVLACVAFLPVAWAVLLAWQTLYRAAGLVWQEQEILTDLRMAAPWKFAVLAVVLAPLTEEVIFRGLIHLTTKRAAGRWAGALLSASLFTLVHFSVPVAPAIFVLGLALVYVYERTGSLLTPIAFHATFNAVTVVGELLSRGGSG